MESGLDYRTFFFTKVCTSLNLLCNHWLILDAENVRSIIDRYYDQNKDTKLVNEITRGGFQGTRVQEGEEKYH